MKKKIIFLITIIIFLTGCSINKIDKMSYDEIIDKIFMNETAKTNTALRGYKLYLPKSMTLTKDAYSNNIIYSENINYYLYVDLISYYEKTENDYKISTKGNTIYTKILSYDNKSGYVLITELDDKYLLEVMYNSAKIEVITNNLNVSLAKSLIILRSITYNDKVIESLIGNNVLSYNEEELGKLGPVNDTSDILKYEGYEDKYGKYEDVDNELPDESKLDIKNNE